MSKNITLISVQTLKDRSPVHKNVDESLIQPEIKMAQDQRIVPALGTKLMVRLQEGIEADHNGDTANGLTADENTLLDDYITDALVQFTLAGLPMGSGFQFFTKGVLRRNSEVSELPSMSDMVDLAAHYENRGEFYRERLINYLRRNNDLYPLYDCSCDNDINPASSGYSTPMWLGDD